MTQSTEELFQRAQHLSPEKRLLLASRLRQKSAGTSGIRALPRGAGQETFPLSSTQQRLWFLEQYDPANPAYIQLFDFRLRGRIRPELLSRCLDELIRRHEVLRTTIVLVEGQPRQRIHASMPAPLTVVDLRSTPAGAREAEALERMRQEARTPFDLTAGPLMRALLLRVEEDTYHLTVTMHHIVTDAWSLNLFIREFAALYTAFALDKPSPLPDMPIQYADYAVWQQEWIQSDTVQKEVLYWKQRLGDHGVSLDLPADHPRPALQTYEGSKQFQRVSEPLARALKDLCRVEGVTPFMLTLAAFYVLLHRYTGQEELNVGSPMANRNRLETEGMLGYFTNTLVLRASLSGRLTFRALLAHVREMTLEAHAHQDVPFEKLVEALQPERDLSRSPLFQVMFQNISVPTEAVPLPDACLEYHEFDNGTSKFDLTLQVAEMVGGLTCTCEYNRDLFEPATITRLLGHYETLLQSVVADPDREIGLLPLLTSEEQAQQARWNSTEAAYRQVDSLADRVEEWAMQAPLAVAVKFREEALTYRELNARANQLAHFLRQRGVGPETCVGVFVERSAEMLVALLGILKAGGAYVPMDPVYPTERLASILDDIQTPLLLTQESLRGQVPDFAGEVICLDRDWPLIAPESAENPERCTTADNLAYVIFTSGSTGRPKGVQITHRSVAHLLETTRSLFEFGPQDIWSVFHSYAFDFSVWEIWSPLTSGGCLVLVPSEVTVSPEAMADLLRREQVTIVNMTPSALRALAEHLSARQGDGAALNAMALRFVVCGGEALPGDLAGALLTWKLPIWNFYGPTEATVWAAIHPVRDSDSREAVVCIGRPLPNTQLYVLDSNLQRLPAGIPGELHIGGIGLARGYLQRPELTAERFIQNPFDENPQGRLYKTGDLAIYRPDGEIAFVGRRDYQVKLRGFRIELGEIEAALCRHPSVRASVVVAYEDGSPHARLIAYLVADPVCCPDASELRSFLRRSLPDYMIPAAFIPLDTLPLNSNGKVDRKALPSPEFTRSELEGGYTAPQETLQIQLQQIWEKVLGTRPIGVHDNFFDLGGHSLLAIRLLAQIEKLFGKKLPLAVLFQAPTIERLAAILRQEGWSVSYDALVAIQSDGARPPLFCVHGAGGEVLFYHDLVRYLAEDQPLYGLQSRWWDESYPRFDSVEEMAAHYLREVRTIQTEGPYYLCGASLGGMVAYEMACQLRAEGQEVAFLGLFDGFHPNYLRYRPGVTALHRKVYSVRRTVEHHAGSLKLLPAGKRWRYIKERSYRAGQEAWWFCEDRCKDLARAVYTGLGREAPRRFLRVPHRLRAAAAKYVPPSYGGRMTLFRATEQPLGIYADPTLGWGTLVQGGIDIYEAPGFHAAMVTEPRVRFLAAKLRPCLEAAQSQSPVNAESAGMMHADRTT